MALGLEEGEAHATTDEQPVHLVQQVVDDPELVGDLRATKHHDVRAIRVGQDCAERLDLLQDERSGGVRKPLRDVGHRRLLAVTHTEAVVDVAIAHGGKLVGERASLGIVLAGLAGVEAQVLQQRHLPVRESVDDPLCRGAHGVAGEGDVGA